MTTPSIDALLLRASDDYTVLAARHICDIEGYAFFRVEDGSQNVVAQTALCRGDDGLEARDSWWCEWSAEVQHALDSNGALDRSAIQASIFQACLEADEAR
jgi:hypothetical protein